MIVEFVTAATCGNKRVSGEVQVNTHLPYWTLSVAGLLSEHILYVSLQTSVAATDVIVTSKVEVRMMVRKMFVVNSEKNNKNLVPTSKNIDDKNSKQI